MRALILAGGFGTRMRPLTNHVPKSLLPICNRPFLEHQVRLLATYGVTEATLLTGYLPEPFDSFARDALGYGVRVTISTEDKPLGTAGAIRSQLEQLDGTTIVFNGDVLTDLDVGAMVEFHRARGAVCTISLTHVDDAGAYGLVPMDGDGRVQAFVEKPPPEIAVEGGWINAGTYVLEPRALADVPPDVEWSIERQTFPTLLAADEPLYGFCSDSYWLDIGTPARYLQAHIDILEGRAHAAVEGRMMTNSVSLPDGTTVIGPCLLSHAAVEPGVHMGPLVSLGPGCHVGAGATIERSVLHEGASVGARAVVRNSIIGAGARVEPDTECIDQVVA